MNTHKLCRLFALLLSAVLIIGVGVTGTVAYVAAATPAVQNTFTFDPNDFPMTPEPTPAPTPEPIEGIDLPNTGDSSSLALWCGLLALSAAGAAALGKKRTARA